MGGCEMRTGMLVVLVRGGIGAGVGFVLIGCFRGDFRGDGFVERFENVFGVDKGHDSVEVDGAT